MRRFLICLIFIILNVALLSAQMQNPVSWTYSTQKVKAQTWKVRITATIEERWYLYSQDMNEGGPLPTKITFDEGPDSPLLRYDKDRSGSADLKPVKSKFKEIGDLHTKFEEVFGMETKYFKEKVTFEKEIVWKGKLPATFTGKIEYMTCNGEQCLPPTEEKFSVVVK